MSLLYASENDDIFAITDLWKPSAFSDTLDVVPHESDLASDLLADGDPFAPLKYLRLQLPNLEDFHYGPVENIPALASLPDSVEQEDEKAETTEDDIWQLNLDDDFDLRKSCLNTWEAFEDAAYVEPCVYLSEAGPRTFDAWLASSSAGAAATTCRARTDPLLKSLLSLGLGRESAIFKYESARKTFCTRYKGLLLSGYSPEVVNSTMKRFTDGGNKLRAMDTFVQRVYRSYRANSTLIAFTQALSATITHLKAYILATSGSLQSILQLQALFNTPFTVISDLHDVVMRLNSVEVGQEVLSILFDYSQKSDDLDTSFQPILLQIMARASVPWLRMLESAIGLHTTSTNEAFGICKKPERTTVSVCEEDDALGSCAGILLDEDLSIMKEVSQSRQLLLAHVPNHNLSRTNSQSIEHHLGLEWGFGWKDMERIQAKADKYEKSLLEAINSTGEADSAADVQNVPVFNEVDSPFGLTLDDTEEHIALSHTSMLRPLPDPLKHDKDDALASACQEALSEHLRNMCEFTPPLAIIPSLSFSPIIAAQARLVNLASLRLVFIDHKLQQHLSLQRRFQLFGDGFFVSRLSHALLNPELPTSQRRTGRTRDGRVGLNLGFRNSWPPASSELRLALMGILKDCFRSTDDQSLIDGDGNLPGGLTFGIRDLPEEQIQQCLDPDSVEALDFLCLQYKPPRPLDTVFTQSCLDKYDQIFKRLLRVSRMMFLVNQMQLESIKRHRFQHQKPSMAIERFRVDAYQFVSIVSAYFVHEGTAPIWSRFESSLDNIAFRITGNVQAGEISEHDGLHQVREAHERILDHIMFALLSRKRQERAMQLLEDIFRSILLFAKESRKAVSGKESTIESLYEAFKTKVGAFILLCRELSTKKGLELPKSRNDMKGTLFSVSRAKMEEENTLSRLLLKLEMNGYFNRFCKTEPSLVPPS